MLYYLKLACVLVAGLLLGRWFDQERKKLKAQGYSLNKAWVTTPGIIIIIVILALVAFRVYLRYFAGTS